MSQNKHLVVVRLEGPFFAGTRPLKLFDDEDTAKRMMAESSMEFRQLMGARVAVPAGPKGNLQAIMTVGTLLADLGMPKFVHIMLSMEVEGLVSCPAGSKIVVPS